jgi:acetyl esterase/lipase
MQSRFLIAAAVVVCSSVPGLPAAEPAPSDRTAQQQRLLRRFDKDNDGKISDAERQAIREARRKNQAQASRPAAPAASAVPAGVRRIADVVYAKVGDEPLLLDIFLPDKKPDAPLPVILWVHGGAWVSGDKSNCPVAPFAARGYAVISIDYRLSGKAKFPAQIQDCKGAVRWVRAHAAEYGFDPDRIGASGGSAGGHLVALMGTAGDVKELEGEVGGNLGLSSRVQAVCDLCGPTDFLREEYVRARATTQPAILERALVALIGGPWEDKRDLAALASPVKFISRDDPPFLIVHGDADNTIPVKHSQTLYDQLKAAGLDATIFVVKGAGHGVGAAPGVMQRVEAFFDAHLKGKPAK